MPGGPKDGWRARGAFSRAWARLSLGVAILALGGCDEDVAPPPEAKLSVESPNIVVVMTDDQDVASMETMPIVERELVDKGVEFTDSYVGLSECCPSRATFLTGQHAHNHGVEVSRPPKGGYAKLDSTNTLAVWLDDAGYRTGQVGKYLNYYGNSNAGNDPREVPPGWDDWHVPVEHTEFQVYDYLLNENGELRRYGHAPSDYSTDVFADRAVEFIDDAAQTSDPFFLWVTPAVPHTEGVLGNVLDAPRNPRPAPRDEGAFEGVPFPKPASFAEIDESDKPNVVRETENLAGGAAPDEQLRANYLGRMESLIAVDRMVGDIIAALRRNGELGRTYVIFTSDNGYLLGEHRQVGKHLVFEESIGVPLVIRGPDLPRAEERPGLVQNIDLAPTILEATGAEPGRRMDGISLLPLAQTGESDPGRHLLIEYLESNVAFKAVRSPDGFVYVEYDEGSRELYDLNEDPHQLENVAGQAGYADISERLASELDGLRECRGAAECR